MISLRRMISDSAVFIGETREDYQAALSCGIGFIGRDSGKDFAASDIPIYKNMSGIREYINDRYSYCSGNDEVMP